MDFIVTLLQLGWIFRYRTDREIRRNFRDRRLAGVRGSPNWRPG